MLCYNCLAMAADILLLGSTQHMRILYLAEMRGEKALGPFNN